MSLPKRSTEQLQRKTYKSVEVIMEKEFYIILDEEAMIKCAWESAKAISMKTLSIRLSGT